MSLKLEDQSGGRAQHASPQRSRLSLDRISRHAREHGVAVASLAFDRPIDHTRLFTSPSLAPLAGASIFARLTTAQQRRYNQLLGLMQNELICFFEQEVGSTVLRSLLNAPNRISPELRECLRQFLEDEKQHTQMFRRLNELAEPHWYGETDYHILRMSRPLTILFRRIASQPVLLPLVFWMMLLMEERSLQMSKAYAAASPDTIDEQFLEVYLAHAEDEVRHVQIDWHLLEQFFDNRPKWLRKLNAWLLEAVLVAVLFKPKRANVRLIDLLVAEFPELQSIKSQLVEAVHNLVHNSGYRKMMYSPEATPISCALLDGRPELARLRRLFVR
jgi:para-aminobenzoate N-oxygenase AurF